MTPQRQIIYETLMSMPGHPSAEAVYAQVKEQLPSISLATVYKNLHLFIESGIIREMSQHHGTLRLETKAEPHDHLVCRTCRKVWDIEHAGAKLEERLNVPDGFKAERYAVEVLGVCQTCQEHERL